jgi:hypothetical protein
MTGAFGLKENWRKSTGIAFLWKGFLSHTVWNVGSDAKLSRGKA